MIPVWNGSDESHQSSVISSVSDSLTEEITIKNWSTIIVVCLAPFRDSGTKTTITGLEIFRAKRVDVVIKILKPEDPMAPMESEDPRVPVRRAKISNIRSVPP